MYGLDFRELTKKDLYLIEKWYGIPDCFGYATGFRSFSEARQRLLEPAEPDKFIYMITIGNKKEAIGFIYSEIINVENKPVLWIYILLIEPEYQHKGYGTCAVNKLFNGMKSKYGSLTCMVSVSEKNFQGISFWEKAGFTRSSSLENSLLHKKHVAIYQKII